MSFQRCPQCHNKTLASTGAFWCCISCDTAITSQALAAINAASHTRGSGKGLALHRPV